MFCEQKENLSMVVCAGAGIAVCVLLSGAKPSRRVLFLTDWNSRSMGKVSFVGLKNYMEIFTSNKDYAFGIFNTLKFTVISNILKIVPALFLAIMLQEGIRGKNVYRTILYLPSILPFMIIGLTFKSILNYNTGLLNTVLGMHLRVSDFSSRNGCRTSRALCGNPFMGWMPGRALGYVMHAQMQFTRDIRCLH